jgi:L-amino acid N-acyltransferase YncA
VTRAPVQVRDATTSDVPAISSLANALIDTTTFTWTEHRETIEHRTAWFERQLQAGHPTLVAVVEGAVVGYASFGDFRDSTKWPGYRFVVEQTVHVDRDHWGGGVGRALISVLIERAALLGKTQIIAGIDGANEPSIRFHERLGFVEVARMPAIGFKFGQWLDLVLMQRATVTPVGDA